MTNSDSVKLSSNNSLKSLILHLYIKQDLTVYLAEKSTIEFENVYKNMSFQSKYRPIVTKKRTCRSVSTVEMVQNLTHSQVPPYTSLIVT